MKRFVNILLALTATLAVGAQVHYQCDFENPADVAQWQLNVGAQGPQCINHWYVGEEGNFSINEGKGLYIAPVRDTTKATYDGQSLPMSVMCYVPITLQPGNYNLEFDWRCQGSNNTGFVVAWVEAGNRYIQSSNSRNYSANIPVIGNKMNRSTGWTAETRTFTVTQANSQGWLVFIWDQLRNDANKAPSACVDNIIIRTACNISQPSNVKYDTKTARLSWNASTNPNITYDVRDYCVNDNSFTEYSGLTGNFLDINLVAEGTHTFSVRAVDDDCVSQWVSVSSFSYIPGKRCIEYLDLGASVASSGKCYHGNWDAVLDGPPHATLGMVNNGTDDSKTLHCIHTNVSELDPRTQNELKCVPDGEIASVRIGAFERSQHSALVEYTYTTPQGATQLLDINYAAVLEWGHSDIQYNARFDIQVLDMNNNPIGGCTQKTFFAGDATTSGSDVWHVIPAGATSYSDQPIYWSDWQKVTVSLADHPGQTLKIRIIVPTCQADYHWAYAYFTLGCRDGGLEGLACGDMSTDHFEAPDNFTYIWYKDGDAAKRPIKDSLSCHGVLPYTTNNNQVLHIDSMSSEIYHVECHDLQDPTCYYTLTANPNPRFPLAKGTITPFSRNCQNQITFTNESYVRVINRADSTTMSEEEAITTFLVDYGDGSPVQTIDKRNYVTHDYPNTGGTFTATLWASMNDGVCIDDTVFVFTLPDIEHTGDVDTSYHKVNTPYMSKFGTLVNSDRDTLIIDSVALPNMYGCEAYSYEYIYYFSKTTDTVHTVICEGDSAYFLWTDRWYYQSTFDSLVIVHPDDADTTHYFDLYVVPRLRVAMPLEMDICGRDRELRIPLEIEALGADQYAGAVATATVPLTNGHTLQLREESMTDIVTIQLPRDTAWIQPDYYMVQVTVRVQPDPKAGTLVCGTDALEGELLVRYDSTVIDQKFEYVALLNPAYNYGGWSYDDIHWYVDGIELFDQRKATFLHTSAINTGMHYSAELRRTGHDKLIPTCELTYTGQRAVPLQPNASAPARELGTYDVTGNKTAIGGKKGLYFVVYDNHETKKVLVY